MNKDEITELLERLGYEGARLNAMLAYLSEFQRRLSLIEGGALAPSDIVTASLVFDGFNRKEKGKK